MKTARQPFYETPAGFLACAAAVGLIALLLRLRYSAHAMVETPIGGDATQYVAYAWNMLHAGVFSNAIPGSGMPIVADAYRGPGYPAMLYLIMAVVGEGGDWYSATLRSQAFLGAATAVIACVAARRVMGAGWAIAASLLVALWPHLITMPGYLFSETLFGFLLLLSLWLAGRLFDRPTVSQGVAAGIAAGLACLVNPVYLLFPPVVATLAWPDRRSCAIAFMAASMALPLAWSVRNAGLPEATPNSSRLAQNLVQGSWPLYHAAYNSRDVDPVPRQIMAAIGEEERLLTRSPAAGLRAIRDRIATEPGAYVYWYLVQKPFLLWDWDIRIGQGDVYLLETRSSPIEKSRVWRGSKELLRALNPAVFALASIATMLLCWRRVRGGPEAANPSALILALFFAYITALHVALQAEPRYAIPYRPVEILLAVAAVAMAADAFRNRVPTRMAHG